MSELNEYDVRRNKWTIEMTVISGSISLWFSHCKITDSLSLSCAHLTFFGDLLLEGFSEQGLFSKESGQVCSAGTMIISGLHSLNHLQKPMDNLCRQMFKTWWIFIVNSTVTLSVLIDISPNINIRLVFVQISP